MPMLTSVGGVIREVGSMQCGVDGVLRDTEKAYCGVEGVTRELFNTFDGQLYDVGNEFTEVTGGWKNSNTKFTYFNLIKATSKMTMNMVANGGMGDLATASQIDLTNFTKINFKVGGYINPDRLPSIRIGTLSTLNYDYYATYEGNLNSIYKVSEFSGVFSATEHIYTHYLSSEEKTSRYVILEGASMPSGNYLNIYKIWLE